MFERTRLWGVRRPKMNKPLPKRLNWEGIEKLPRQEGRQVVKGTNKRVVVVKSPDPKIFEQAIFILKEDFFRAGSPEGGGVLRQAQKVADDYVKNFVSEKKNPLQRIPPPAFAGLGAIATALAWLVIEIL